MLEVLLVTAILGVSANIGVWQFIRLKDREAQIFKDALAATHESLVESSEYLNDEVASLCLEVSRLKEAQNTCKHDETIKKLVRKTNLDELNK